MSKKLPSAAAGGGPGPGPGLVLTLLQAGSGRDPARDGRSAWHGTSRTGPGRRVCSLYQGVRDHTHQFMTMAPTCITLYRVHPGNVIEKIHMST